MLDLTFVRQQFPAFNTAHDKPDIFFENAGGSYMCQQVISRFDSYFHHYKVQPYYPNRTSETAGQQMTESYSALANWLGVTPENIFFGPSTSQNTYTLAQAVLGWLKPGDEIIVTNQDHEANIGVWRRLASQGIIVKEWPVDSEGSLRLEALTPLITSKTKLLTFTHCSNVIGEINPVKAICDFAQERGIKTIVDGVSYAGHGLPNVDELGADIYLFSLYKVYGPHQGVMVIKTEMQQHLANQAHYFLEDIRVKTLNPAGPDHAQVAAIKGVSDYFDALYTHHASHAEDALAPINKQAIVKKLIHNAEQTLSTQLLDYLSKHPKINILGPKTAHNRAPTIAFTINGYQPSELAKALGERNIMVGCGHFYAYRLFEALSLSPQEGALRLSMLHYNAIEEINQVIQALEELIH